ncbi:MAG: DNA repair protein RadC [Deltaproteobacteria bacterium]|nr:DNA repair protein RadC [Deltaproteobacteria bacterium]
MASGAAWLGGERPRERLSRAGAEALDDAELLALVLGTGGRGSGGVLALSQALLARFGGLEGLQRCRAVELQTLAGVGWARASALVAVMELGRRSLALAQRPGPRVTGARDAYHWFRPHLASRRQEVFVVLSLDAKHRPLAVLQVAQGSVSSVEVHPREVFAPAVREQAAAVIVAHNHPSGDPEPSAEDRELTRRLRQAGQILGIPVLDHLVVARGTYTSFAERGWL